MSERSSTPESFNCKMPPNEIDETLPTLEPFVFTLDPQNVEEDLEYINEHNLNSSTFWRGVCSQYHQIFLEIRAEVDEAKMLEEPLDIAKIEQKLSNLEPPQEIPHILHIITQPKIPNEKKSNKRSAKTLIEQMYKEYQQTDLAQAISRRAERASNLTFSKCLHLADLNNPRILMMHDKMAVTANMRA